MTRDDILDALQRSRAASTKEDKARLRAELDAEVDAFIKKGGTIQQIEPNTGRGIPCQF